MAYKPNIPTSRRRDRAYPSEVAAQRPMLAPRIHCEMEYGEDDPNTSIRHDGVHDKFHMEHYEHEPLEDICHRFNRALRSGHGFRNEGEE